MATVTYSGSFNGAEMGTTRAVLSGTPIPTTVTITDVSFSFRVKSTKYKSSYEWVFDYFDIESSGLSPYIYIENVPMSGSEYTFTGSLGTCSPTVFSGTSISVDARAHNTGPSDYKTVPWDVSVIVTYEEKQPEDPVSPVYPVLSVRQNGNKYDLSWTPGRVVSELGELVTCTGFTVWLAVPSLYDHFDTTNTSVSIEIPPSAVGTTVNFFVMSYALDRDDIRYPTTLDSNTVYITTVAFSDYISYGVNGSWVDCVAHYGANGQWVECKPYYSSNGQWVECTK